LARIAAHASSAGPALPGNLDIRAAKPDIDVAGRGIGADDIDARSGLRLPGVDA